MVEKNRGNAQRNPMAAYGADISVEEVLRSMPLAEPLKVEEAARPADGSIVMVLATEEAASRMKGHGRFT